MKTIFITISRGSLAVNILGGRILSRLTESGNRVVVLSSVGSLEKFVSTFKCPGVVFEKLRDYKWKKLDFIMVGLHRASIYNASVRLADKYGYLKKGDANKIRSFIGRFIFRPLRRFASFKKLLQSIDAKLLPGEDYLDIFKKYNPDLVFSTNPLGDSDSALLKQAQALGVPTVAMPKSWDNLPKMNLRVKPDALFLWGEANAEDALKFQGFSRKDIFVVGVPQFDDYADKNLIMSREDFFRQIGADPAKAMLVFGSEGKITPTDPEIAEILIMMIERGEIVKPAQLFIRPYFSFKGEEEKFTRFKNHPGVIVDRWFKRSEGFSDGWDYTRAHKIFFTNLLHHLNVMICHASTLTLDAAAMDKPIVNVAFDGRRELDFGSSTYRWYFSEHFDKVRKIGAGDIAKNYDELRDAINDGLTNPNKRKNERQKLTEFLCYKVDGMAGERIAEHLLNLAHARK